MACEQEQAAVDAQLAAIATATATFQAEQGEADAALLALAAAEIALIPLQTALDACLMGDPMVMSSDQREAVRSLCVRLRACRK